MGEEFIWKLEFILKNGITKDVEVVSTEEKLNKLCDLICDILSEGGNRVIDLSEGNLRYERLVILSSEVASFHVECEGS